MDSGSMARTSIVTGGASGIGRAIAQRFAASGAYVFVLDIRAKEADETAREILEAGGKASAHVCDVTNQEEVQALFRTLAAPRANPHPREQCRDLAHRQTRNYHRARLRQSLTR